MNPGTFTFRNTGVWGGGPIVKNKLFVFGNYENEKDTRPLHTFTRQHRRTAGRAGTSRACWPRTSTRSARISSTNFNYDTGAYREPPAETPAKRYLIRSDYNLNNSNKISFRYNQLDSSYGKNLSGSTSAGLGRHVRHRAS